MKPSQADLLTLKELGPLETELTFAGNALLKARAIADGMLTLRSDGWRRVLAGQTTIEEVVRVTQVDEAMIHCAKAMMRARLWEPETRIERKTFPRFGEMKADQIAGIEADDAEARIQDSYQNRLY